MGTEEKQLNKLLYKLELYLIKMIPTWLAMCYFTNTTLSYFGIDAPILSLIGGISILPLLFLYLSSFAFKFCIYHRLPLYYITISDILAYYDMYVGIPCSTRTLFSINMIITSLFLFLILYLKPNYDRNYKRITSKRTS